MNRNTDGLQSMPKTFAYLYATLSNMYVYRAIGMSTKGKSIGRTQYSGTYSINAPTRHNFHLRTVQRHKPEPISPQVVINVN